MAPVKRLEKRRSKAIFGAGGRGLILRTSWVIGPVGKNFALTMLRLHRERDQLGVVADQVGCPTSTLNLAQACWRTLQIAGERDMPAVMHWSDNGAASWYDVAVAVGRIGTELGLIDSPAQVQPITTSDYPTPAERPSYSLLGLHGHQSSPGAQRRALAASPKGCVAAGQNPMKLNLSSRPQPQTKTYPNS